jgi:hypothetical protein
MATKVLVELDCEINGSDGSYVARLTHKDLQGILNLRASSESLMAVQLQHIRVDKSLNADPLTTIMSSANRLMEGVKELKEVLSKE